MISAKKKNIRRGILGFLAVTGLTLTSGGLFGKASAVKAETTYEKLTSIASIDSTAKYVLGIDGTGFHYTGTSSWGKVSLPSANTPYYYTLTASSDNTTFTAETTIDGTLYYLTVPGDKNNFVMSTEASNLKMGTAQSDSATICNETTAARHLRLKGTSGIRSYQSATGSIVYFYKVVEEISTDPSIAMVTKDSELILGKDESLTVEYSVLNVENPVIVWTSSNADVASVADGVVTPLSAGTTTISASIEGTEATASLQVTVRDFRAESAVENEIVIDASHLPDNVGTGYSDNVYGTLETCQYYVSQTMTASGYLQLKAGEGALSNLNPYSKNIRKIVLGVNAKTTAGASWEIYAQDALSAADETKKITPVTEGSTYTYDLSSAKAKNFTLRNSGTGVLYLDSITIEFTEKYEILVDEDNGTAEYSRFVYAGDSITLTEPVKAGYVFSHWEDGSGNRYQAGDVFTPTQDDLLVAYYEVGNLLEIVNTQSKLNFSYTKTTGGVSTVSESVTSFPTSGSLTEDTNLADFLGFSSALDIRFVKKNSSTSNVDSTNVIRLYANDSLVIAGANICGIDLSFNSANYGKNLSITDTATSTELYSVGSSGVAELSQTFEKTNSITLTGTSQLRIKSMTVYFEGESVTYTDFGDMVMHFGATIETATVSQLGTELQSAGVLIQRSAALSGVESGMALADLEALDTDGSDSLLIPVGYENIVQDTGSIRVEGFLKYAKEEGNPNYAAWNEEITAAVYIVVDGKVYFTTSQTYSVKSKLQAYLSEENIGSLTEEQIAVIKALLADSSVWGI